MNTQRILLFVLGAVLLIGQTACEPENVKFVQDMATEWANAKGINPTDQDGSINAGGAANALLSDVGRKLGASTGDPETDAALDAKNVIESVRQADELTDEALKTNDLTKIDQAIKQRPDDYSLYNARGAILLARDDDRWKDAIITAAGKDRSNNYLRDELYNLEKAWPFVVRTKGINAPVSLKFQREYCSVATEYAERRENARTFLDRAKQLGMDCAKANPGP